MRNDLVAAVAAAASIAQTRKGHGWLQDVSATPYGGESILSLMRRVALWLAEEQTNQGQSIVVTRPTIIPAALFHCDRRSTAIILADRRRTLVTRLSGIRARLNLSAASCTAT